MRKEKDIPAFRYKWSSSPGPITVEGYRRLARAVPDMVWAYVGYGADDPQTLRANREASGRYALRSRVLTGNQGSALSVTVSGETVSLPVLLAPTGPAGISHWMGEVGAAPSTCPRAATGSQGARGAWAARGSSRPPAC